MECDLRAAELVGIDPRKQLQTPVGSGHPPTVPL